MNILNIDLNESDLFYKSSAPKRKASESDNLRSSKQLKLNFTETLSKINEAEKNGDNSSMAKKLRPDKNQSNQSQSGYFHVKKSMNTCPLCLKSFQTDSAYSAHMKQCAKTHKMTTQQLLGALELQKKQIQERRDLGLCSQGAFSPKKTAPKKRIEKCKESYDLALGLALSKSLTAGEPRSASLLEAPKTTLEEFGFTSCNATVAVAGPVKRKNDGDKKSLLKERTAEERQRIIIEKVAVVLLDEDKEQKVEHKNPVNDFQNVQAQATKLWSKGENNCKTGWYVSDIIGLEFPDERSEEEFTESAPEKFKNEIVEMNLPQKDISTDWRKIINSKKLSDLVGKSRDGQEVFVHSVVLYARYPDLLRKDCTAIFEKFNLSTILIFLEYLYCGTLNSLCRAEVDDLYKLASEFDYGDLIQTLKCLKNNLSAGLSSNMSCSSGEGKHDINREVTVNESKKAEITEDKDEGDVVDLTQASEGESEDLSNAEKSFWSFIQHQKRVEKLEDAESLEKQTDTQCKEEKTDLKSPQISDKIVELRRLSDGSTTKDWNDIINDKKNKTFSECVILSSGSDTKSEKNFIKSQRSHSRTPSPINVNYEVPHFDPYDNFHCFSEEPFSPVGLFSQSLITGDISMESPEETSGQRVRDGQAEPNKAVGYCSTPVRAFCPEVDLSAKSITQKSRRRKRCDLSSSRLLRKSLGLHPRRNSKSSSFKRKQKGTRKSLEEALTNSVLNELSKCSAIEQSPIEARNFIEITPISSKEFADSVTPSPNYSTMGEALLKEQLSKYGLKKNLAKSKAKKILRLIYEELHPLYNTETGKIVKLLPGSTPKGEKKSKGAGKSKKEKKEKKKSSKNDGSGKKINKCLNSFKESENLSGESVVSFDRSDHTSDESDFESLNETLTQSLPTNPVDLPSAFSEFLQKNPEYHQKILLYEPVWLEEIQKKLKEYFKKHFKLSDLMTFLDQKCIAFRSTAQARKIEKRFQKKKDNSRNKKNHSKENSS